MKLFICTLNTPYSGKIIIGIFTSDSIAHQAVKDYCRRFLNKGLEYTYSFTEYIPNIPITTIDRNPFFFSEIIKNT